MTIQRVFLKALPILILLCIAGCKDNNKDDTRQQNNQETSEMPSKNGKMDVENDPEREAMPDDAAGIGAAATTGGSTGASNTLKMGTDNAETASNINMETLYAQLEMTDEQIKEFKAALSNENPDLKLQDTNGEIPGNLYDNMESKLESILDEAQLEKYREWKKGQ